MAYIVNRSDGSVLATVPDGSVNTTSSSITLIGKNYAGYGEALNENFVRMLENFSAASQPTSPQTGQLWWDNQTKVLNVYDAGNWKRAGGATSSATAPTGSTVIGDFWWDTTNAQLNIYDGTQFILVGPQGGGTAGESGSIVTTITDSLNVEHVVVRIAVNDTTVAYYSKDAEFVPASAISGFASIKPGLNFSTAISGNRVSGNLTGNVTSTGVNTFGSAGITAATESTTTGTGALVVTGGVGIGARLNVGGNVAVSSGTASGSTTTGALTVSGGVGVTGNANIGGNANISGNAVVSGELTGTTQTYGTSNTTMATTAFVQAALRALYPIGSVYTNADSATNPGTLFGFGTWAVFGAGRVMVGINASDTDFDTAGETGGAKTVSSSGSVSGTVGSTSLTESQMPKHFHTMIGPNSVSIPQGSLGGFGIYGGGTPDDTALAYGTYSTGGDAASGTQITGTNSGDSHTHSFSGSYSGNTTSVVQPYVVVYMWRRTA